MVIVRNVKQLDDICWGKMVRKKVDKIPKNWKPVFGIKPIRKGQNRMKTGQEIYDEILEYADADGKHVLSDVKFYSIDELIDCLCQDCFDEVKGIEV